MPSWTETRLTELLGLRYPIIQAPMAGSSTPAMAIAVSNAGGMGSLGCAMHSLDQLRADCQTMREGTNGAYNINFFAHAEPEMDAAAIDAMRAMLAPYYAQLGLGEPPEGSPPAPTFGADHLAIMLEERPAVVSFHFDMPDADAVSALKEAGIVVLCSATNGREAREIERLAADAVIAQGFEAGGHRGTFTEPYEDGHVGTMALVPQIADAVSIPVIAAGGIMDGRGIAAALALGAEAVQVGTAFLTSPESACNDVYRDALTSAGDDDTRLTNAFSGRPARGIENRYIRETAGREAEFPAFPIINNLTNPMRKASGDAGTGEFMALWAGQGVTLSKSLPAAELLEVLVAETEAVLARFA